MCTCVHVYMCICVYVYMYMHICICICVYVYVYTYIYIICIHIYIYVYDCLCICMRMYNGSLVTYIWKNSMDAQHIQQLEFEFAKPFASLANTEVRRATAAPAPSRAVLATTPAKASVAGVSMATSKNFRAPQGASSILNSSGFV